MNLFPNSSLQQKQTLIIMLTSTTALLLACIGFVVYEAITFRDQMTRHLTTVAEMGWLARPTRLKGWPGAVSGSLQTYRPELPPL